MSNEMTVKQATSLIQEKKAQVARMTSIFRAAKDDLALVQAATNSMIESGEIDLDAMEAIHNKAEQLKEVFAQITLETSMD
ncbi:hypothetical protein NVP1111B_51 [Vibrio phage 1.111.B._10N.286.45.E6]|nr:hypothetical protein NVP1111A_51 [Vibrio phage 1.111.A._10N.286.45.E6]AUR88307.1 hypothetical protein NVP1111B_51 [Vibrio phage 1.111.B._10N.286.45.E6]